MAWDGDQVAQCIETWKLAYPRIDCFALDNAHPEEREFAIREFEAEGDSYSRDILAEWHRR